ncbi:MAG TPA: hypothetical protein VFU36_03325, partial [Jatrophihabitans sp.]|nr:hypothetical protein [Jatrophihabitans sp.]
MSQPPRLPDAEPPPIAQLTPLTRTGAGHTAEIVLDLVNAAAVPRLLTVTVLGLDADWLPRPVLLGPVPAGGSARVELGLRPPSGTLPASYPYAVAVQAGDPR